MKVGPALIEKEIDHQLWRISLTMQNLSYYTNWYSSHLYTPREALAKYIKEVEENLRPQDTELIRQIEAAMIFLEAEEQEDA
jgi:hypothetical protein